MGISEAKMKIVIDNYFKTECNVNTSIKQAFEKGFRIGVKKGMALNPQIIRCKDCKWYEQPNHKIYENCVRWKDSNGILLPVKPDDFCNRAERKDNGRCNKQTGGD